MSTEAPFNADLATAKWVNKLQSSGPITNQDLFELTRDILQIHAGEEWESSPLHLFEEETPRNFLIRYTPEEDPPTENFYIEVTQGEDCILEEIMLCKNEMGSERFTTCWRQPVSISSSLLGYDLMQADEILFKINLQPEQIFKLAKLIWDAHAYTLVDFGKKGLLGLPIIAEPDSISVN